MIEAIIPVPVRSPVGTMIHGKQIINTHDVLNRQQTQVISGRSIRVVPLTFYKVFSSWNGIRYEHTFATDELLEPLKLASYQDPDTGSLVKNAGGGILVPISVKKIDNKTCGTHLFSQAINYLLTYYRIGKRLVEIKPLVPEDNLYEPERMIAPGHNGVRGFADYQLSVYGTVLNSVQYGWNIPKHLETIISTLTPELPEQVHSLVDEILYNRIHTLDRLADYIDDYMQYHQERKFNAMSLIEQYLYNEYPFDPITLHCILSPSFIMARSLRPFLGYVPQMECYNSIGYNPTDSSFTRNFINMQFNSMVNAYDLYDVVEQVCNIPDTDFKIYMDYDNFYPENLSVFGHNCPSNYTHLYHTLRNLFLNRFVDQNAYDNLYISKNWHDEIFISCMKNGEVAPVTFYINLAWFHLMSPSLINQELFDNTI